MICRDSPATPCSPPISGCPRRCLQETSHDAAILPVRPDVAWHRPGAVLAGPALAVAGALCAGRGDGQHWPPERRVPGRAAGAIGGGGKPHMATAGAKDIEKLDEVLGSLEQIIQKS